MFSIWEDGYTMPCVCYYRSDRDEYELVDGYHRYLVLKTSKRIYEREKGMLPVTVIEKDISNRMASTIRHNRARGTHSVELMSHIVSELTKAGMSDQWILRNIGMDRDELLRLKQISGLAELFADKEISACLKNNPCQKNLGGIFPAAAATGLKAQPVWHVIQIRSCRLNDSFRKSLKKPGSHVKNLSDGISQHPDIKKNGEHPVVIVGCSPFYLHFCHEVCISAVLSTGAILVKFVRHRTKSLCLIAFFRAGSRSSPCSRYSGQTRCRHGRHTVRRWSPRSFARQGHCQGNSGFVRNLADAPASS